MKKVIFIIITAFSFMSCSELFLGSEPPNTPEQVFESFWQECDQHYSGLSVRGVNWDSLYKVYRPQINAQTTESDLKVIIQKMITTFKDGHFSINTKKGDLQSHIFPNENYLGKIAIDNLMAANLNNYKNLFYYGISNNNIGYIHISTFKSDNHSQDDFLYFDSILETMKDTKGLIIDVRMNSGGNVFYGSLLASRFVTKSEIYKYERLKTGIGRNDYSDFKPVYVAANSKYTKPVVLLINQGSFSTSVSFSMILRMQPNVTLVGTKTGDGVVGPIEKELPNGWTIYRTRSLAYFDDKTLVEGRGVKPKIEVYITEEDKKNGYDRILAKGLEILK